VNASPDNDTGKYPIENILPRKEYNSLAVSSGNTGKAHLKPGEAGKDRQTEPQDNTGTSENNRFCPVRAKKTVPADPAQRKM
jgi:hypothetical protein